MNRLYLTSRYDVKLHANVFASRNTVFEGKNVVYNNTTIYDSTIGYGTYISNNSHVRFVRIGRYCAIGDNLMTYLGLHPTKEFVSIHPAFFSLKKQAGFTFTDQRRFDEHTYVDAEKKYVAQIGNDVWIGNNVMIFDGVTVGDGAIIAAGSIVTKNVEPYSIVAGVPAKMIRKRFDEETIVFLLEFKWWDKSYQWLQEHHVQFSSIGEFIKAFRQHRA